MLTRRRSAVRLATVFAVLAATVLMLGSPSTGQVRAAGASCPPEILWCSYGDGGTGSGGGGGGSGGGSGGSGGDGTCAYPLGGVEYRVACYVGGLGFFNTTNGCYYLRLVPQPPLSDPIYQDHTPGTGAVYRLTCYSGPPPWARGSENLGRYWIDQGAPALDPVDLAFAALAKIRLDPADIHTAPSSTGVGGLVGLPVWMWTPRTANTWGPLSASQTAGPLTVNIRARATKVVWNMGDGHSVTCTRPGTAYAASYGGARSPNCGYTYTAASRGEIGGRYTITATTTWRVTWNGGGQNGVITVIRVAAVDIQINEAQVVVK
jgi:hypothetical protein